MPKLIFIDPSFSGHVYELALEMTTVGPSHPTFWSPSTMVWRCQTRPNLPPGSARCPGVERTTMAAHRGVNVFKLVNLLRGDLGWIVMKCLEKDRGRRWFSNTFHDHRPS
jgi:hypothetical protein